MGKQAPASQDFKGAAEQTSQSSAGAVGAQTRANRPDVQTAFGSNTWEEGPGGKWTMKAGMSPGLQGLFDDVQGFDFGSLGQVQDGSAARDQATDAAYQQAVSRLNPQWDQRETQMRSRLAQQGLDPNTEASRNANQQFNQGRNDAYGSAMNSAIGQGREAGESVFRQNMMARQQQIAEALRSPQLEGLRGMMGFMQGPGFHGAGAAQGANYLGAAGMQNSADLQRWMAENQANADAWGGGMQALGSAASIAGMLSDERAKADIVRLTVDALPGVPFATWRYRNDPTGARHAGVIAQDLEKVAPKYVTERDGLKYVDYSFLFLEA